MTREKRAAAVVTLVKLSVRVSNPTQSILVFANLDVHLDGDTGAATVFLDSTLCTWVCLRFNFIDVRIDRA